MTTRMNCVWIEAIERRERQKEVSERRKATDWQKLKEAGTKELDRVYGTVQRMVVCTTRGSKGYTSEVTAWLWKKMIHNWHKTL